MTLAILAIFSSTLSYAEGTRSSSPERYEYDYPELSVVPRASDRLRLEAEKEPERKFTTFIPLQVSALATTVAGLSATGAYNSVPGSIATGVGLTWLAATTILAVSYDPYTSAYTRIGSMPKNTVREQLARERAAEEEIKAAATLGNKIRWLSWLSNLGASIYILAQSNNPTNNIPPGGMGESDFTRGLAIASTALSFVPYIFKFHWNEVQESQTDYKKRIYAPVVMSTLIQDPATHSYVPGLLYQVSF